MPVYNKILQIGIYFNNNAQKKTLVMPVLGVLNCGDEYFKLLDRLKPFC